jgi:hypothetical protein
MDVSTMVHQGYSIDFIKSEISPCEVVCASCHMRRKIMRKSYDHFRRFWPKLPLDGLPVNAMHLVAFGE